MNELCKISWSTLKDNLELYWKCEDIWKPELRKLTKLSDIKGLINTPQQYRPFIYLWIAAGYIKLKKSVDDFMENLL